MSAQRRVVPLDGALLAVHATAHALDERPHVQVRRIAHNVVVLDAFRSSAAAGSPGRVDAHNTVLLAELLLHVGRPGTYHPAVVLQRVVRIKCQFSFAHLDGPLGSHEKRAETLC